MTPWCHGEDTGSDESGWPGTDFIENLLLQESPESYDAWLRHDIGFDSPSLHQAFDRMARVLLLPGQVVGGHAAAANRDFATAALPLFEEPPGCLMYLFGTGAAGFFPFGTELGRDVGVFPFPPISPEQEQMVLGAGDYAMAFRDRPEVREVMRFLAGSEFGRRWASIDPAFMSPGRNFPQDAYATCPGETSTCEPDAVKATLAPVLSDALRNDRFRFDGSDPLPHDMGLQPMWEAMVEFVGSGPGSQDRILAELESVWDQRERAAEVGG